MGIQDQDSRAPRATGDATVIEGQRRALELVIRGAPLGDVLDVLVRTIEAHSVDGVLGSILLLDAETSRLRLGAAPSLDPEYNQAIDGLLIGPSVGSCGTAAFLARTVVVENIETDPLWADFKELALRHGLRGCWSTPVMSSEGAVLATFALYSRQPARPNARDVEIVGLLAHTAALVIERDLHARQRAAAETASRAAHVHEVARMRAMFEHAPAAIALLSGPRHTFEIANPRYDLLIGNRSILGKSVAEALPEIADQGYVELLDEVRRTGQPYIANGQRVDVRRGADGALDEGYLDFVFQPIPGAGRAVDSILVVAFEVTETVKAKRDLEAALARAKRGEEELRAFIDGLPELAWTARPDGHIDYYNRRWYEYTGTTFESMQGWGWEQVHDPQLLPDVVARWKQSLETGAPFDMEFTLRGADGVARWFLTRVAPARDGAGNITRWFGVNTNIDEIKAGHALTAAVAEQSRDVQRALVEMRTAKEDAERRAEALEATIRERSR